MKWLEIKQVIMKARYMIGGLILERIPYGRHEIHPVMNILPLPDEDGYRSDVTVALEHKYFTKEPWIETNGMGYISGKYESKTFTSFAHSMEEIVNGIIKSNMEIRLLNEYDYDIGLSDAYDGKGLPLSMLLVSEKH